MRSSDRLPEARTWLFKVHSITRPASANFNPEFSPYILDACKARQMSTMSKTDTICYSATEIVLKHAAVEGFMHAIVQAKIGCLCPDAVGAVTPSSHDESSSWSDGAPVSQNIFTVFSILHPKGNLQRTALQIWTTYCLDLFNKDSHPRISECLPEFLRCSFHAPSRRRPYF